VLRIINIILPYLMTALFHPKKIVQAQKTNNFVGFDLMNCPGYQSSLNVVNTILKIESAAKIR